MRKNIVCYILPVICLALVLAACSDNDSFSTSRANLLSMETDTVKMDTVFSRVPASTRSFWVHNDSGDGIRCTSIRLQNGNQSGFRVNVDGIYLGDTYGYQTSDVEIRKGDSIRVFVELTAPLNYQTSPKEIEDNLVFTLESGVQQVVNLNAWSWDADLVSDLQITSDTTIDTSNGRPMVVYGGITVCDNAELTIAPGSTLYFHDTAGINVFGKLNCQGTADRNIVLRCDRLDNMFDYLPYDNLPSRWAGIKLKSTSFDNVISYTDIHGTFDAIVCDSSDVSRTKLTLSNSTLHNCGGYGLYSVGNTVEVSNTQITNTLSGNVAVYGGSYAFCNCTLAQFYPFDSNRGAALLFSNTHNGYPIALSRFDIRNCIVTGYADDEIMGEHNDTTAGFEYSFAYSLLRTPSIDDAARFDSIIWEDVKDNKVAGVHNFIKIDTDSLRYDFHLDTLSLAVGKGNPQWALPCNRDGKTWTTVNIGCY